MCRLGDEENERNIISKWLLMTLKVAGHLLKMSLTIYTKSECLPLMVYETIRSWGYSGSEWVSKQDIDDGI